MKLLIIGNPIAGGGKARPRIEELVRRLTEAGHHVEARLTTKAGDAKAWAGQVPADIDRLIVAGGDGTLNEVLNGLVDPSRTPIVQMPVGTANVLVRELKLPWRPEGVAKLVETGRVMRVDLCEARGTPNGRSVPAPGEESENNLPWRRFLVVMSTGFDAMVIEDIHRTRKGKLGFFGYMKPILRTMWRYAVPKVCVRVDGGEAMEGAMVVIANASNYAGLFCVADKARMDSGVLDVCVLPHGSVVSLMWYAFAAWRRKLSAVAGVRCVQGAHVTISCDRELPVELDGELFGPTPVEVRLTPGVVPIVVPDEGS